MIKGMIFDLDGTTLYTLEDIYNSFNLMLKENGYPEKSIEEIRMGVGNGFRVLTKRMIKEEIDEEKLEKLSLRYRQIYKENYYKTTIPYEGIKETLRILQEKRISLSIHSNKSDMFTKDLIARNFSDIRFACVCGAREGIAMKPDPEAVERILREMEVKKEEALYVGDSEVDMMSAKNAGLKAVGCLWGYRDYETLKENGADYIIREPREILNILKEEI